MQLQPLKARWTALAAAALVAACGGGNPLGNAPDIQNGSGARGQKLSFAYFQRCVQPIFEKRLPTGNTFNTCAGGGCHDNTFGTGAALRLVAGPATVDLNNAANTADVIRASDMYKNFYTAQGATVIGDPAGSRLFAKPLVLGTLHGGGQIFPDANDPDARTIAYWITHPAPDGQDEFSPATWSLLEPADPMTGACKLQ